MEEGATTIADVLPEVLIQIFKKLSEDSDLSNAQQVSSYWSELVDKRVGRKVCVGVQGGRNCSLVEVEQLSKIGIQSCYIFSEEQENEAGAESKNDELQNVLGEGLKYPYLLKYLYLHGAISSGVFMKLVERSRNLSFLEITLFILSKLHNEDLKNLVLPKLKELYVGMIGVTFEDRYLASDNADFLPNLKTLFVKNRFPQLTTLTVQLSRASLHDLSVTGLLTTFVQNHHALQVLQIYLDMTVGDNNATPEPVSPTNHELRTIIAGIQKRGEFHLKHLQVVTLGSHRIQPFPFSGLGAIEILNELILNILSLRSLMITLEPIPSSTLQAICTRNAATLMGLIVYNDHADVSCSVFASLRRCLIINFNSRCHGAVEVSQLPATVMEIELRGPIEQDAAEHILFNLPNIRDIKLSWVKHNNSVRDGACVTLDMLRRFNQDRMVRRLRLSKNCLVDLKSFPPEGIPNNDPNKPKMLCVGNFGDLDWRLNKAGFYTT